VFRQLNLGWIGKIDMVPKKVVERNSNGTVTTKEFMRVFIHFTKWFTNNHQTKQFLERIDSKGFVHIIYDEPWFWKVTKYVPKERKPEVQPRHPRPRIDFGDTVATATAAVSIKKPESNLKVSKNGQFVPVQVKKQLQVTSESKKKYWKQQAEIATAVTMKKHNSASPTPHSHDSDSESSPSPVIQRTLSVRLFDETQY
jgi:hypothetical protein